MTRTNQAWAIAQHAPVAGYFTGSFALRGPDGPDTLRGPFNEIASAIKRTPESTVYRFDAFALNWAQFARPGVNDLNPDECIVDVPWADRDGPELGFSVNPETMAKIMSLVPEVVASGESAEVLPAPTFEREVASPNAHIFAFKWRGAKYYVDGWAEVEARAPFIRWTLIPRRYDGQPTGMMRFSWPWSTIHRQIGFADISIVRVTLQTSSNPNELEQQAFNNAAFLSGASRMFGTTRIWRGVPHKWGGELFGQGVVLGSERVTELAAEQRFNAWSWAGRDNPNATGVDASFGSTWTAPIWPKIGAPDPRVIESLADVCHVYGARPCHWSEPGDGGILRVVEGRALTLHKGQPYNRAEADSIGVGTQFRGTQGSLDTYDHEHRSIGPLAAFAALTGDHGAHYIADSYLAAECYERSVASGWTQPGRGQGLPWIAGNVLSRITNDEHLRNAWLAHDAKRLAQYRGKRLVGRDVTVGGLYYRSTPWTFRGRVAAVNGSTILIADVSATPDTLAGLTVADIDKHYVLTTMQSDSPRGIESVTAVPAEGPSASAALRVTMRDPISVAVGDTVNILCGYSDPYEQGTIAMALLLNGHTQEAFDHGRGIVRGVWWDAWWETGGKSHGAYNQRWTRGTWPHELKVDQPINKDLAPSGDALGMWVGAGLRAFIIAANRLSRLADPEVQVAVAALRDLDPVLDSVPPGELFAAAHRSLWGTLMEIIRKPVA